MVRQWEHMVKYGENMGNMMIKPWGFWGSLFSDKARNRHETANWHCLEPKGRWTCVYCHIWREYEWVVDVVNQELNHVESLRKAPTTPATPHPKALRCSSSTLSPEGIRISWQRWGVLHKKTQLYITIHHTTTILVTSSCYTLLLYITSLPDSRCSILAQPEALSRSLRRTCKTATTTSGLHGSVPCIARNRVNCGPSGAAPRLNERFTISSDSSRPI